MKISTFPFRRLPSLLKPNLRSSLRRINQIKRDKRSSLRKKRKIIALIWKTTS